MFILTFKDEGLKINEAHLKSVEVDDVSIHDSGKIVTGYNYNDKLGRNEAVIVVQFYYVDHILRKEVYNEIDTRMNFS